jgi:hypothetical protein
MCFDQQMTHPQITVVNDTIHVYYKLSGRYYRYVSCLSGVLPEVVPAASGRPLPTHGSSPPDPPDARRHDAALQLRRDTTDPIRMTVADHDCCHCTVLNMKGRFATIGTLLPIGNAAR